MNEADFILATGARIHAQLSAELRADARDLQRALTRLDELAERMRARHRERAEERIAGESDDGLAQVVRDGRGVVVSVALDPARYRRVTTAQIIDAVLTATERASRQAAAPRAEQAAPTARRSVPHVASPRLAEILTKTGEVEQRLNDTTVKGVSPDRRVSTFHDGTGRLHDLEIDSRALVACSFSMLAGLIAAALRDGEAKADAARMRAFDAIEVDGDSLGNWRRHPHRAGELVHRAFGVDGPVRLESDAR